MSGGVDSSVAAALLVDGGHDVTGATMKLWGGPSDSGCCSVGDVDDAARVAAQLGIDHHVFNFSADFDRHVVGPYVADHAAGRTPNPCVACNAHLKFDRLLERATRLGFDALATGHHARVDPPAGHAGRWSLRRGADPAKDQSYVLHVLGQDQLRRLLLPVGAMTKAGVRAEAARRGLRTASKPDSQDVCFVTRTGGRAAFLGARIPLHPGRAVDTAGRPVGDVPAVELVTVGQRRGLHLPGGGGRRYALEVDVATATVVVGGAEDLLVGAVRLEPAWCGDEPAAGTPVAVQASAHAGVVPARWLGGGEVAFDRPARRIAPGQAVVLYDGDVVLGGGPAVAGPP